MSEQREDALAVEGLVVEYQTRHGRFRAVDDVTLRVGAGETVGLVGESGSGKTTIGRAVLGLVAPTAGRIEVCGQDVTHASRKQRRAISSQLQVVFQDPYGSMNPALKIWQSLREALPAGTSTAQARTRIDDMLTRVGLSPEAAQKYPSNFSGGQRQRLAIARALMPEPQLVICDEPVSALDTSIQAQVLNLLRECQRDLGLSYLFIGHDLDVVRFMSDRIVVLYHGEVMEEGPADQIATRPASPYTQALVDAAPKADPAMARAAAAAAQLPPRTERSGDSAHNTLSHPR